MTPMRAIVYYEQPSQIHRPITGRIEHEVPNWNSAEREQFKSQLKQGFREKGLRIRKVLFVR